MMKSKAEQVPLLARGKLAVVLRVLHGEDRDPVSL